MERKEISEKIIAIIEEKLDFEKTASDEKKEGALFREDLNGDSLDAVEVIMEIERAFGVTITDEEGDRLCGDNVKVSDFIDLACKKVSEK
jgi:acyl carrier protein